MVPQDLFIDLPSKLANIANSSDTTTESEKWKKRSIYKIPISTKENNQKAYEPQLVSFGPYHHGQTHLEPFEKHKTRAFSHFLKRSNKPIWLFIEALSESRVLESLIDSYDQLETHFDFSGQQKSDIERFLLLMIVDGCFMLEVMRVHNGKVNDYSTDDPIFSEHGKIYYMPFIRRDMLVLENQVPILVLYKLVEIEKGSPQDDDTVNELILELYFRDRYSEPRLGKCLHVLDLCRKFLFGLQVSVNNNQTAIDQGHHRSVRTYLDKIYIRSASELQDAGINFRRNDSMILTGISFKKGELKLPLLVVDVNTETIFLNLIAFECLHVGAGSEATSYVCFMGHVIGNERDVALLHRSGIIRSLIGSTDEATAKLFHSMCKDIIINPKDNLYDVLREVNDYYLVYKWRADLVHTYFRSPWALISTLAALLLFIFTILQTVYTVYPFYAKKI